MFLNPPLSWYFAKSIILFNKLYFNRTKCRTPVNSKDKALCSNSLRLRVVFYSIATRSSIVNVGRGLIPAFGYNGIS